VLEKENVEKLMKIFSRLDKTRDGKLDHADKVAWKVRVARRADGGCAMWRSDVAMQKYDDYLEYLDERQHDPSDPRFDGHRRSGSGPQLLYLRHERTTGPAGRRLSRTKRARRRRRAGTAAAKKTGAW
jgi:hypothetical protein